MFVIILVFINYYRNSTLYAIIKIALLVDLNFHTEPFITNRSSEVFSWKCNNILPKHEISKNSVIFTKAFSLYSLNMFCVC